MGVVFATGNVAEHALGLVMASSHRFPNPEKWKSYTDRFPGAAAVLSVEDAQGAPHHLPSLDFEVQPQGNFFTGYLRNTIGYGVRPGQRANVDSGWYNYGHTAILFRKRGVAEIVRGFHPKLTEFQSVEPSYRMIHTFTGEWANDLWLLEDPTSVELQFPITANDAELFPHFLEEAIPSVAKYCMTRGDQKVSFNCLQGAIKVCKMFFMEFGYTDHKLRLDRYHGFSQGELYRMVLGGSFLLGSTSGPTPSSLLGPRPKL